jgi:hypothetical protein
MKERINIDRIAFIGRTYKEYVDMFGLEENVLRRGPVLDCPAGAASFTAEATGRGLDVTACDLLYGQPVEGLIKKSEADMEHVFDRFDEAAHLYTWKYYRSKEDVIAHRKKALDSFMDDYRRGLEAERYVHAELPLLPFPDGKFRLVLSSHFLFLYSQWLDFDFHIASLRELVRVSSGEVRVFPLQGLDSRPYPRLEEVLDTFRSDRTDAEIIGVLFEFQRGGNRMLRISRKEKP